MKTVWLIHFEFLDGGFEGRGIPKVKDIREFTEIVRRCQIPYYEEARQYWGAAKADGFFDDANEIWPYTQNTLKDILERYGNDGDDEED